MTQFNYTNPNPAAYKYTPKNIVNVSGFAAPQFNNPLSTRFETPTDMGYSKYVKNAVEDSGYTFGDATTAVGKNNLADLPEVPGLDLDFTNKGNSIWDDQYKMGNITGLASTLMQAAALPSMLKAAKLQNQSAQHNLDTAKAEQARRNKNIKGFNAPVSAFV